MSRVTPLLTILAVVVVVFPTIAFTKTPNCTHPDAWPSGVAFTYLKNAGLVNNQSIDFKKTEVTRLASEKLAKDLYRQVHLIHFFKKSGDGIEVITVNEVSSQECSVSEADVYLVSKRFGTYSKKK